MNPLQEVQKIRKLQTDHENILGQLGADANRILSKGMKVKIKSVGSLGTVTWSFGSDEDTPHKLNILPSADNKPGTPYWERKEVNTCWGTDISIKEVIKLRDFLNTFLEWNEHDTQRQGKATA